MLQVHLIAVVGIVPGQMTPGRNLLAVAGAALLQGRHAAIFVMSGDAARRLYDRAAGTVEAGFGLVFGAIGGKLLFDGVTSWRVSWSATINAQAGS